MNKTGDGAYNPPKPTVIDTGGRIVEADGTVIRGSAEGRIVEVRELLKQMYKEVEGK